MLARLGALVLMACPALAWACPYCSLRPETHRYLYALGAMILLPWVLGGVTIAIIRRLDRDEDSNTHA